MNANYAIEFGKQKWVPEVQFGDNGGAKGSSNEASDLINMLTVKTAKDLSLDMSIKKN